MSNRPLFRNGRTTLVVARPECSLEGTRRRPGAGPALVITASEPTESVHERNRARPYWPALDGWRGLDDLDRHLGARRLPLHGRRRAVARHLRAVGIPHHRHPLAGVVAVRRDASGRSRPHRPPDVLGPPRAPTPARPLRGARCGACTRRSSGLRPRARPAARRHPVVALLRRQLALRAVRPVVYFAGFTTPSPLLHLWSLAVEEQFYLFWPPIVLAVLWFARRRLRLRAEGAITAGRSGRAARRDRAVRPHGCAVRIRERPVTGVLRHRHARRRCSSAPSSRSSSRCTDPCGRSLRDKPCPSLPRSASWW